MLPRFLQSARAAARGGRRARMFLSGARGGATAITAALLAVGVVGGVALIGDHVWIVGKRDLLKAASESAAMAATQRLGALPDTMSDADVDTALDALARRYVLLNLLPNLPQGARREAQDTLAVNAAANRAAGTVSVTAEADMGGTLLARLLPSSSGGGGDDGDGDGDSDDGDDSASDDDDDIWDGVIKVGSGVEALQLAAIELVFAIDVTPSMRKTISGGQGLTNASACPPPENASRMAIVKCGAGEILNVLDRIATGAGAEADSDDEDETETGGGAEDGAGSGDGGDADDDADGEAEAEAAADPLPVAVGFVPWHYRVRLGAAERTRWEANGWATYPAGERVYPFAYMDGEERRSTTETLPATQPEAWVGCLDRREAADGGTAPGVLALPGDEPFRKFYFSAQIDRGWERFPNERSLGYECRSARQRFCFKPVAGAQSTHPFRYRLRPQQPCSGTDPAAVAPLLADIDAARTWLGALNAAYMPGLGATYSVEGLEWATRLLAPSWNAVWGGGAHPMAPGAGDSGNVMKVIVLLTDGEDTHKSSADADAERTRVCDAAKAAGIRIYVIGATNASDKDYEYTAERLTECSSASEDPDGEYAFLNNSDSAALLESFRRVGRQLVALRRTH